MADIIPDEGPADEPETDADRFHRFMRIARVSGRSARDRSGAPEREGPADYSGARVRRLLNTASRTGGRVV